MPRGAARRGRAGGYPQPRRGCHRQPRRLCGRADLPRESFECLATLNVPTVRGNHDRWIVDRPTDGLPPARRFAREVLTQEQRNALFALPATLELEGGILATHGTPTDDSTYLTEESYDHRMIPAGRDLVRERLGEAISRKIVLCGHSHRQSVTQVPGGPLIVNPGSVGCPVFADIPTAPHWELTPRTHATPS